MKGTIVQINKSNGMAAVRTEVGDHSIIELARSTVGFGDQIEWTEHLPAGRATVRNLSRNEEIEVIFQNHSVSSGLLRKQLRLD